MNEPEIQEGDILKIQDVCAILNLSRSKVYMLMQDGSLPFMKFGRALRLYRRDVEAYVRKVREEAR